MQIFNSIFNCLRKRQGSMFSGTAIMSWHCNRALRIKWIGKPREDERFSRGWNSSYDRVMGPTKAVPDTPKVCECWRRTDVCPQLVCNDFKNVIVYVVMLDSWQEFLLLAEYISLHHLTFSKSTKCLIAKHIFIFPVCFDVYFLDSNSFRH